MLIENEEQFLEDIALQIKTARRIAGYTQESLGMAAFGEDSDPSAVQNKMKRIESGKQNIALVDYINVVGAIGLPMCNLFPKPLTEKENFCEKTKADAAYSIDPGGLRESLISLQGKLNQALSQIIMEHLTSIKI